MTEKIFFLVTNEAVKVDVRESNIYHLLCSLNRKIYQNVKYSWNWRIPWTFIFMHCLAKQNCWEAFTQHKAAGVMNKSFDENENSSKPNAMKVKRKLKALGSLFWMSLNNVFNDQMLSPLWGIHRDGNWRKSHYFVVIWRSSKCPREIKANSSFSLIRLGWASSRLKAVAMPK